MIELFTSVWDMTIAIKSSARRQTIATLLRKHSQPAPCGHRLRWLTKTLAEL